MGKSILTRPSLLVRIRDPADRDAWRQFVEVYAPLVYGFARRRGVQDADAADLTQEVLRAVAGAAGRLAYDPRRGSFRAWLFTITRNKLHSFRDRQARQPAATGAQEALDAHPAAETDEAAAWDRDYDRRLFAWAAERVRGGFHESSWRAFWMTAVEGISPRAAAEALGISLGAVYIARSRVLASLRAEIQELPSDG